MLALTIHKERYITMILNNKLKEKSESALIKTQDYKGDGGSDGEISRVST